MTANIQSSQGFDVQVGGVSIHASNAQEVGQLMQEFRSAGIGAAQANPGGGDGTATTAQLVERLQGLIQQERDLVGQIQRLGGPGAGAQSYATPSTGSSYGPVRPVAGLYTGSYSPGTDFVRYNAENAIRMVMQQMDCDNAANSAARAAVTPNGATSTGASAPSGQAAQQTYAGSGGQAPVPTYPTPSVQTRTVPDDPATVAKQVATIRRQMANYVSPYTLPTQYPATFPQPPANQPPPNQDTACRAPLPQGQGAPAPTPPPPSSNGAGTSGTGSGGTGGGTPDVKSGGGSAGGDVTDADAATAVKSAQTAVDTYVERATAAQGKNNDAVQPFKHEAYVAVDNAIGAVNADMGQHGKAAKADGSALASLRNIKADLEKDATYKVGGFARHRTELETSLGKLQGGRDSGNGAGRGSNAGDGTASTGTGNEAGNDAKISLADRNALFAALNSAKNLAKLALAPGSLPGDRSKALTAVLNAQDLIATKYPQVAGSKQGGRVLDELGTIQKQIKQFESSRKNAVDQTTAHEEISGLGGDIGTLDTQVKNGTLVDAPNLDRPDTGSDPKLNVWQRLGAVEQKADEYIEANNDGGSKKDNTELLGAVKDAQQALRAYHPKERADKEMKQTAEHALNAVKTTVRGSQPLGDTRGALHDATVSFAPDDDGAQNLAPVASRTLARLDDADEAVRAYNENRSGDTKAAALEAIKMAQDRLDADPSAQSQSGGVAVQELKDLYGAVKDSDPATDADNISLEAFEKAKRSFRKDLGSSVQKGTPLPRLVQPKTAQNTSDTETGSGSDTTGTGTGATSSTGTGAGSGQGTSGQDGPVLPPGETPKAQSELESNADGLKKDLGGIIVSVTRNYGDGTSVDTRIERIRQVFSNNKELGGTKLAQDITDQINALTAALGKNDTAASKKVAEQMVTSYAQVEKGGQASEKAQTLFSDLVESFRSDGQGGSARRSDLLKQLRDLPALTAAGGNNPGAEAIHRMAALDELQQLDGKAPDSSAIKSGLGKVATALNQEFLAYFEGQASVPPTMSR